MKLDGNNHSVFLLHYHLVLVVKYRRKVFDDSISDYAKDMFIRISKKYNITLKEWNHDIDHIHIMFKAEPNTEISKFINAYKSASSRLIKKDFPQVKQKLWKQQFWSRSFCLITTGEVSIDVIKEYIENQDKR
ncbi:MAG: IS200/IS605 family transposase [Tissierella sp.]|uniref:IS200/IS605 family transposase n=1 Tax=Tissierella sp. TaxID=41274 RepID=UPI003F9BF681